MKKWTFTLVWLITLVSSPAMGSLHNVLMPDGNPRTLYTIQLTGALGGAAPGDIDSITVTGPKGVLPHSLENFTYTQSPDGWRGFYLFASGAPEIGDYSFTITSGTTSVTTNDQQTSIKAIPVANTANFTVLGNTFSWGAVSLPETNLYYELQIIDASGKNVYFSGYGKDVLSYTIAGGTLTPGQTYRWRVRISDNSNLDAIQNESFSAWVEFTWRGLSNVVVRHRGYGDGTSTNLAQFQLKDASGQNMTRSISLSDVKVYDRNGQAVNLTEIVFSDVSMGTYNSQTGKWKYPSTSFDTYAHALFSDPLIDGNYMVEVKYSGETYTGNSSFNGLVSVPLADPFSFTLVGETNGDLTWSWTIPNGVCPGAVYPLIRVNSQGQPFFFFFAVPPGQCISSLLLPASFVQTVNAMADEVQLQIVIRTDNNNDTFSSPLILSQLAPPGLSQIQGKVTDALTGEPVQGASVSLEPGAITLTSQADGTFSLSGIPAGTYSIQVSASSYYDKNLPSRTLSPGLPNQLNVLLSPYVPKVTSAIAKPPSVGNDGQSKTLLTAHITFPLEFYAIDAALEMGSDNMLVNPSLAPSNIDAVLGDLAPIGGSPEQVFYDDGTHGDLVAGDGTYSYEATVAMGIKAKLYALNVTAIDKMGKEGFGSISLNVTDKLSGTVQPEQSVSQNFDNALGGQTLNIHFELSKAVAILKAPKAECQIQLIILGPDGSQYGPYYGTDSIDVNIPNATAGPWEYVATNQCSSALSYEIETSGSGTGLLVGRVVDAMTGSGLQGASINCSMGGATMSLAQGYYSGVAVAGTGQVFTTKAGFQINVKNAVHVKAGGTTTLNIQIVPQDASAQAAPWGANVFHILDPADDPKPPMQPFAIQVSGSALEFNVLFPRYQQAVDLYLAFTPNSGEHAGKLFLIDENNSFAEFTDTLHAWRTGSKQEESAQIPIPSGYPLGAYTLYSLVTTDSSTLANFDLSYFTTTPTQPPPVGQNVTFIPKPAEVPNPLTQPLAAKVTDGGLMLSAQFPIQNEPVSIFLAYLTPGGALYLIKSNNTAERMSGTLWPWREHITAQEAVEVLSIPMAQMAPGLYYFYSVMTTDPVALSNYELVYFGVNVTQ